MITHDYAYYINFDNKIIKDYNIEKSWLWCDISGHRNIGDLTDQKKLSLKKLIDIISDEVLAEAEDSGKLRTKGSFTLILFKNVDLNANGTFIVKVVVNYFYQKTFEIIESE
ncbi:hypothetical protein [Arsenophonus nasoniae]|uniref:Uncharacterized protein n=1 Tax=Arsenophonus nasoniae TaxID=638 RepID=A0AA95GGG8_9GAMM|nr:hypothetical protein [Arsenophonus nasoniae]WGL96463.1 hypothetical protein QE207_07945 [Arsenophonus nasoniae]